MNEKAVFFFSSDEKKNTASRSNEWMACELLQEKKTQKKHTKMWKKKHTPLSKKIKKNPPDPEWMPHELFLGKKNTPLAEKKKTQFYDLNEWMAHELFREKKYGTFVVHYM